MKSFSPYENDVLKWFVKEAKEKVNAKRVLIFGSRARGDSLERSDFDLAVECESKANLSALIEACEYCPKTLLAFDVVDLGCTSPELKKRIQQEGRDITDLFEPLNGFKT